MTASELGRRLKDARPEEVEALAETMPTKDLLEPLLRLLLWESRRALLFCLSLGVFFAFLATCGSGWSDNFFSDHPISGGAIEVLVQKFSPVKFLVGATFLSIVPMVQSRIAGYSLTVSSRSGAVLLAAIARKLPSEETDALCAKLWSNRRAVALREWKPIEEAIAASLLHRDGVASPALSDKTLRWLRWRLEKTESPEFRVAALLTLAEAGDGIVALVAQKLQNDADERVQAAAAEVLRVVENRR